MYLLRTNKKQAVDKDRLFRIGALGLLFFSGGGLDIASLTGFTGSTSLTFLLIISIYLVKRINIKKYELWAAAMVFIMLLIAYTFKGAEIPIWCLSPILIGYFTLTIYKRCPEMFISDLSTLCKWYAYYTILSVLMLVVLNGAARPSGFYRYYQIFYLFWYVTSGGPDFLNGLRVTGLGGEPGIWQLFLSFNLLFTLYEKRKKSQIILAVLAVIGTFSTTAYFNLIFIIPFYYGFIERRIKLHHSILLSFLGFALFGVMYENISDKLSSGSGLTRISDIFIGWMFLKRSPLWGIDPSIANNSSDSEFLRIKYAIWGENNGGYIDPGYLESGLCSGLMWLVLDYGILFSAYVFYKYFQFPLMKDKFLRLGVLIIILLTLLTEPFSRSGFFYFFTLAAFIKFNWKNNIVNKV